MHYVKSYLCSNPSGRIFQISSRLSDCQHGLTFDTSDFSETLPGSLGWTCGSEQYTAMWLSVGMAGNFVGILVFTSLSDM